MRNGQQRFEREVFDVVTSDLRLPFVVVGDRCPEFVWLVSWLQEALAFLVERSEFTGNQSRIASRRIEKIVFRTIGADRSFGCRELVFGAAKQDLALRYDKSNWIELVGRFQVKAELATGSHIKPDDVTRAGPTAIPLNHNDPFPVACGNRIRVDRTIIITHADGFCAGTFAKQIQILAQISPRLPCLLGINTPA